MFRHAVYLCLTLAGGLVSAQPDVPPGYTVRRIAPLLDGKVPELAAISDSAFGTGVITAAMGGGVVTIRLIEPTGALRTLGTWAQAPSAGKVVRVRLDSASVIDGNLHISVQDRDTSTDKTHYLTLEPSGTIIRRWTESADVAFDFEFSEGEGGNPVGAVLLDGQAGGGTQLAKMDTSFVFDKVKDNSLPSGRTDLDVFGMARDVTVTARYGGGVLLADSDCNPNSDLTVAIYGLKDANSTGSYHELYPPVTCSDRRYGDLSLVASGDFGDVAYVTETLTDEIQKVLPDGTHEPWATGFAGIDSLSIAPDGSAMYVGDLDGVWLIRAQGNETGPVVLCQEPGVPAGSHLSGAAVTSLRIVFNEAVSFSDSDVAITDGDGASVGFDASGSGSQFMLIGLGAALYGDTYTVIIADSLTSVATGEPLDGDNDGFSGGDASFTFTHRCPGDFNGDEAVNTIDVIQFLNAWTSGCP